MTIALLSHTYKQGNSGGSGTSPAIDTTGASLLVAYVADFTGSAASTFADSQGNTWTALTARPLTGNMRSQMYYCAAPTTSASHTFSATGTNSFAAIAIAAYSGTATSPYDQETGATTLTGTSLATGSVTPSENNELVIYGCGYASSALSVSVGTMLDTAAIIGGTSYGIGLAYEIQTTATARSPSWSWSSSNSCSTTIATFKAAGGGATNLTVPDSSHAHTLDNAVLTTSTTLAVQDMAHSHALDAPTLSTGTALAVADSAHVHALDNVTLSTTGATSLTVADSLHGHALDAVGLTSQAYLAVADMLHAHALDGVTLTLGGVNLTVAELLHAHALDNTTLTLDTYLAVADALHAHTLDNVVLSTPGGTLDLILKILANRQELNPTTGTFTLYDNDGTTVLYTTSAWADAAGTVPYSGGALRRIDALF
jgi:hypothetical protein